ncbi:MAG: hypothetical protein WC707_04620 [Candidatus Babeliaceae bacterium]
MKHLQHILIIVSIINICHITHTYDLMDASKKINDGSSQLQSNKNDMLSLKTGIATAQSSITDYTKNIQDFLAQERQQMSTVKDLSIKVHDFLINFNTMGQSFKKKVDDVPVVGKIASFFHIDEVAESLGNDIGNIVINHVRPVEMTLKSASGTLQSIDKLLTDGLTNIGIINGHLNKVNSLLDQITQEQDKTLLAMKNVSKYLQDMSK